MNQIKLKVNFLFKLEFVCESFFFFFFFFFSLKNKYQLFVNLNNFKRKIL